MNDKRHLTRWIVASVNKWFHEKITPFGLHVFIEGTERKTRNETDFVEVRIDGPRIKEVSNNCFDIQGEINCLIQSVMREDTIYDAHTDVGYVTEAFTNSIPIYRYGDGTDDDGSLLGCFKLKTDKSNDLDVSLLGRVGTDAPLNRAVVEGHYRMLTSF